MFYIKQSLCAQGGPCAKPLCGALCRDLVQSLVQSPCAELVPKIEESTDNFKILIEECDLRYTNISDNLFFIDLYVFFETGNCALKATLSSVLCRPYAALCGSLPLYQFFDILFYFLVCFFLFVVFRVYTSIYLSLYIYIYVYASFLVCVFFFFCCVSFFLYSPFLFCFRHVLLVVLFI